MKECIEECARVEGVVSRVPQPKCRLTSLPNFEDFQLKAVPRNSHVDKLLCFNGTVVKITEPKMLQHKKDYICLLCKKTIRKVAEYDTYFTFEKPKRCPEKNCDGKVFKEIDLAFDNCQTYCIDYQEIKVQEKVSKKLQHYPSFSFSFPLFLSSLSFAIFLLSPIK